MSAGSSPGVDNIAKIDYLRKHLHQRRFRMCGIEGIINLGSRLTEKDIEDGEQ